MCNSQDNISYLSLISVTDTEGDTILTPENNDTNDGYKTDATETPTSYGDDESTPTTELPTTEGKL